MSIQLIKTQAKSFSLAAEEEGSNSLDYELQLNELNFDVRVPETANKEFAIGFSLEATALAEAKVSIQCEFWAFFASDEPLTQAFLEGSFTQVNAPAIAYPYLRSFVTTSLVNAGYTALYLPTINFVERNKK